MSQPAPRPETAGLVELYQAAQHLHRLLSREYSRIVQSANEGALDNEVAAAIMEVLMRRINDLAGYEEVRQMFVVLVRSKLLMNAIDGALGGQLELLEQVRHDSRV